jgi:hypothetical protein
MTFDAAGNAEILIHNAQLAQDFVTAVQPRLSRLVTSTSAAAVNTNAPHPTRPDQGARTPKPAPLMDQRPARVQRTVSCRGVPKFIGQRVQVGPAPGGLRCSPAPSDRPQHNGNLACFVMYATAVDCS